MDVAGLQQPWIFITNVVGAPAIGVDRVLRGRPFRESPRSIQSVEQFTRRLGNRLDPRCGHHIQCLRRKPNSSIGIRTTIGFAQGDEALLRRGRRTVNTVFPLSEHTSTWPHVPGQLRARYTVRALGPSVSWRCEGLALAVQRSGPKPIGRGPVPCSRPRCERSSPRRSAPHGPARLGPRVIAFETRLRSSCWRRSPSQRPRVSPITSSSSRWPGCAPRNCSISSANTFAKSTFANVILIPKPNLVRLKSTKSSSSALMELRCE